MSDPVSVRHVIASSDYSERIQKAEAVQDQIVREQFNQELQRQENLRRTQVTESEEGEEARIRNEERERRRKQEQELREAKDEEEKPPGEEAEEPGQHLIDLKV